MDMTKEALQYINELNEPYVETINGQVYSDKNLYRIDHNPKAKTLQMSTLSSLLDYIKNNTEEMSKKMIVQVCNATTVKLLSCLDNDRVREILVEVNAMVPEFEYGKYLDHETFLIALQSQFIKNEDRDLLLQFAGTVEDGTITDYSDTGYTQKATVKSGIASKSDKIVPNPVSLRPFRTFLEVEQPESSFVFRMSNKHGVECAIFEADGGAWTNEATKNICGFLQKHLKDFPNITVIA